jgi:FixJ family two-component response regulator
MNTSLPATLAVVDDDESVRVAAASLLRSCGWAVRTYACGQDLLSELGQANFRLVIADLQMPEMDGFALLDRITGHDGRIPVIFITAHATPDIVAKVASTRAVDFFPKPLDDTRLLARVSEIVQ